MNDLLQSTAEALRGLPPEFTVFLISALPIFEIRGGIIAGLALFHMSVGEALLFGFLGNIASVTPVLLFLEPLSRRLYGNRTADRLLHWLFQRSRRHAGYVNKWGAVGLAVFTSIPLPGNGAWTAVLLALLVNMHKWQALAATYVGILVSGSVVAVATAGGMAGIEALTAGAP